MDKKLTIYHEDCKFFRGDIPCKPHKEHGVHCHDCEFYKPLDKKILIIKLGAIGDVIRTTPLLHKIREEHPDAAVWWLTYTPDIVPSSVENILNFSTESVLTVENTKFDKLINLDKDPHACALASRIEADEKFGYVLKNGKPAPVNELAKHKFLTGIFDDVSKMNKKSYPEEIFEICGWEFSGEEYMLDYEQIYDWELPADDIPVIGLNTGCGARWPSRLWPDEKWEKLIILLQDEGYFPVLLGGEQEHERNRKFAEKTGAYYPGYFSLQKFISLIDTCDVVVTAVTMALHLAVGLRKNVVLMNNIFNPDEFELYGRGEIVSPDKECKCFYSPHCTNEEYFCMEHLGSGKIFNAVKKYAEKL